MARINWLVPPPVSTRPPLTRGSPSAPGKRVRYHRTIFISDIHLGMRGCKAEILLD
ncbi:MAG: UDP-2,3-diacylglucosamine diphosphatase, partial [Alphaproteobacteria bacterium]|nr:UDP-2,3-diacylglucosamine diphosphatase [Alphaproteobacteria bacterium]